MVFGNLILYREAQLQIKELISYKVKLAKSCLVNYFVLKSIKQTAHIPKDRKIIVEGAEYNISYRKMAKS